MSWLVPKLSLSAEAQLEHNIRVLREEGANDIEGTVRIACALIQQNAIQQAIIRQAIGHIGQLEMEALLGNQPHRPRLLHRIRKLFARVGVRHG